MEHPSGDLGKQRAVTFLGSQILIEQPQGSSEQRIETMNVCYTFPNPEGRDDEVGSNRS